jgi:large conductance mechanosensitive channel
MADKKKGFVAEFKEFIMRGNVMDMAVGVIIATAFGKITTSLVNDICMPLIGMLIGGIDLSKLDIMLKPAVLDEAGEVVTEAVVVGIGTFITTIIDFILVALVVFCVIKGINKLQNMKKAEEEAAPEAPPEPTKEEQLLTEIRDLLKDK